LSTIDGIRIHPDEAKKLAIELDSQRQSSESLSPGVGEVSPTVGDNLSLAVATAYKALERSEKLEAQLEEERSRADLAEKRRLGLEIELSRYRCVLSENAESLAEERAKRVQLEALESENKMAMEQWEAEKAALIEKVKLAETRVSWMEQRVPRWVRALFRAG
jgi:chromosome segregation ATPase